MISSARARAACRRCALVTSCAITRSWRRRGARRSWRSTIRRPPTTSSRSCARPGSNDSGWSEWGRHFGVGGANGITTEERRNGVPAASSTRRFEEHEDDTKKRGGGIRRSLLLAPRSAVVGERPARVKTPRASGGAFTRAGLPPTRRRPVGPACQQLNLRGTPYQSPTVRSSSFPSCRLRALRIFVLNFPA